jgi:hypothetical protein
VRTISILAAMLLGVALLAACGAGGLGTACSSSNCSGCCDATGACQVGDELGACGRGGSLCTVCSPGQTCIGQACTNSCMPNCSGKACGSDGCGGSCGSCLGADTCDANGQCVSCTPSCSGKQCGANGCGGSCGTCPTGQSCDANGQCVNGSMACSQSDPNGTCPSGQTCVNGSCCSNASVCGGGCCGASEACLGGKCCPLSEVCGTACVPAGGVCLSSSTAQFCAVATGSSTPTPEMYTCPQGDNCQLVNGIATCVVTGGCQDGATQCASTSQLQTCTNGAWVTTTCAGTCITTVLGSLCGATTTTQSISATLQYEYQGPNAGLTDWDPTVYDAPANHFLLLSCTNGSCATGNVIDVQYTSGTGSFTLKIAASPGPNDYVFVLAAGDDGNGNIAYVVANPNFTAPGTYDITQGPGPQPNVWSWSIPSTMLTAGSTVTITEAIGSPAARILDYVRYIYAYARSHTTGSPGLPVVAWVQVGTAWSCGSCLWEQPTTLSSIPFQAQVFYDGSSDDGYWADPVTAHELGHWTMASYGRPPGEGGQHCIGVPDFPGLAWSEGWATWFSSDSRTSPIYYDKQQGAFFWWDISQHVYGGSESSVIWQLPTVAGGLMQHMDENEVSAMLWSMSTSTATADDSLFAALISPRMNNSPFARGYTRHSWTVVNCQPQSPVDTGISAPFFADFLDALNCEGFPAATIDAATQPTTEYPYPSNAPLCLPCNSTTCPTGCCASSSGICFPGNTQSECGTGGGTCQNCGTNACGASGTCVACTPSCSGKQCGANGCGGACGTCASGAGCASGTCVTCSNPGSGTCSIAGSSYCGGTVCCSPSNPYYCAATSECYATADAAVAACGSACVGCVAACVPNCTGLQCGPDGCGGSCGTCGTGTTCNAGTCVAFCMEVTGTGCASASCLGTDTQCYSCAAGQFCTQNAAGCSACSAPTAGVYCCSLPSGCTQDTGTGCVSGSCAGSDGNCYSCNEGGFCTLDESGCSTCGAANSAGVYCCSP